MPRVELFGIPVARLTMIETLLAVEDAIENGQQLRHIFLDALKIVRLQTDEKLRESVLSANLISADGLAVLWASRILGRAVPECVAGIDLMENLIEMAHENSYKVFFLGGNENQEVLKCVRHYTDKYSSSIIAGYHSGDYADTEERGVAEMIADSGANLLFMAIASPKKEIFLNKHKDILSRVNMVMGLGGSFEDFAAKVKYTPLWMQDFGLEWFYRFISEPQFIWERYVVANAKFMSLTLKERLTSVRSSDPVTV